ncbi:hypothetical protein ACIBSV_49215 [Embleya sp. NPDC050154]|uniref:hypothetical protein n=1 Tax=Embleya sp. NPDC050154 TaxID=3363988 RepID=UPI0037B8F4A9
MLDALDDLSIASPGGAPTFLGATEPEWVAGIIVGIVMSVTVEVLKVATKRIGTSLPFVLLRLAKISMPRDQRSWYADVWVPELHELLTREGTGRWSRYRRGLGYALALAFGGGRRTGRAAREPRPHREHAAKRPARATNVIDRGYFILSAMAPVVPVLLPVLRDLFPGRPWLVLSLLVGLLTLLVGCFSAVFTALRRRRN